MFSDLTAVFLLLVVLAAAGLAMLALMDFLRGKKIRLKAEPKERTLERQSSRRRVVDAVLHLLFAFYLFFLFFPRTHTESLRSRPVAVFGIVCASALLVISLINLWGLIGERWEHPRSTSNN